MLILPGQSVTNMFYDVFNPDPNQFGCGDNYQNSGFLTKKEEDQHITKEVIKSVRRTGQLNLSSRHIATVPEKLFSIYDAEDESTVDWDFGKPKKEEDSWWNIKPLSHLDLSSNVLTDIPGKIGMFQDLLVLNLHCNNLTELPKEIGSLQKLTKLTLNSNKLTHLPDDFFKLVELRQLTLGGNCLESISKDISDLVMLEKLDLSNNSILNLPPGMGFLIRLTELNVAHNKLTELPPDIVNLRSLLKLDINHNSIQYLPVMGELRKLQILHAQHNDIAEIPSFLGCEKLQEIYFGNNFIKDIPLEFCENMYDLKVLELRDNQIELIPPEITTMVHLTRLDLTNNDIKELPSTIGLMPHLQVLKLEGNKLKQMRADIVKAGTNRILRFLREKISEDDLKTIENVPSDVNHDKSVYPDKYTMRQGNIMNISMKNIDSIPEECFNEAKEAKVYCVDLCKNKFTIVPEGLKILANDLTELNLSENQIKELPDFLKDFAQLKFLDLSRNMLTGLPDSFTALTSMRELVLSNNRLTSIPKCISGMVGLEILLLNENCIASIDIDVLQELKRLATLDLTNNSISSVPPQLGNMTQLR
ncbi:unnamed protein product [Acanthoscelides obtectus]|nr:unnamed protein product [Acanthoscelides obtectus]CAK1625457.1 Leucine-rich repeat-containing protein 40 [Acanthoscelides obtectus]